MELSHKELMQLLMLRMPAGQIVTTKDDLLNFEFVFGPENVNAKYYNLLRASLTLYQTLQRSFEAIEVLIKHLEDNGVDALTTPLMDMQGAIQVALRVAREGIEPVADQMTAHKKG